MFVTSKIRALLPKVVTRRDVIRGVPDRWYENYPDDKRVLSGGRTAGSIRDKLEDLDVDIASVEDVAAIIGNSSWTELKCDACESDRDAVVSIPREYEVPLSICGECAAGVAEMLAASVDTLPKGQDSEAGLVRSKGSAVGEAETPKTHPDNNGSTP